MRSNKGQYVECGALFACQAYRKRNYRLLKEQEGRGRRKEEKKRIDPYSARKKMDGGG